MGRRRPYARRRLWRSFWVFLRDAKQVVAIFVGAEVFLIAGSLLTEPSRFLQGLLIGSGTVAIASAFGLVFLISSGSMLTLAGAWAEDFANDQIKRAVKRGHVWGGVANIEVGGFDVDHLVVAPGGVLAIETKAHSRGLDRSRAKADLAQARDAARKASSILRSKDIDMPQEVRPVLAIWGSRATATLPQGGRLVDGVHVVAVADLGDWLGSYATGKVGIDYASTLLDRLKRFRDRQELRQPDLAR